MTEWDQSGVGALRGVLIGRAVLCFFAGLFILLIGMGLILPGDGGRVGAILFLVTFGLPMGLVVGLVPLLGVIALIAMLPISIAARPYGARWGTARR